MRKLFLAVLTVAVIGLSACGGGGSDSKSTECKITVFVTSDGKTWTIKDAETTGTINTIYSKVKDANNLTVKTLTTSEKATVIPTDAATMARDYTEPQTFTVTAEDGKTSRIYTVQAESSPTN